MRLRRRQRAVSKTISYKECGRLYEQEREAREARRRDGLTDTEWYEMKLREWATVPLPGYVIPKWYYDEHIAPYMPGFDPVAARKVAENMSKHIDAMYPSKGSPEEEFYLAQLRTMRKDDAKFDWANTRFNYLKEQRMADSSKPQPGDKVRYIFEGYVTPDGQHVQHGASLKLCDWQLKISNVEKYQDCHIEIIERALPPEPPVGSYGHYTDDDEGDLNYSVYVRTAEGWSFVKYRGPKYTRSWKVLNGPSYMPFVVDYIAPEPKCCHC